MMLLFGIFSCFVATVIAQVPEPGKCPDVPVKKDFEPAMYYGKWYEITKFYSRFESGQKCHRAWYSPKADGHFWVFNLALDQQNHEKNITGDAFMPDTNERAKIQIKFSSDEPYVDYWVLATDYTNYTLVYSCINQNDGHHLDFAWILSRKTTLEPEVRKRLYRLVDSYGINSSHFQDDDQRHCFY